MQTSIVVAITRDKVTVVRCNISRQRFIVNGEFLTLFAPGFVPRSWNLLRTFASAQDLEGEDLRRIFFSVLVGSALDFLLVLSLVEHTLRPNP
jgi:hypothetical protein